MCGTKVCKACGEDKPLDAFSPQKGGALGRKNVCKSCRAQQTRELHGRNPEARDKHRSAVRSWRARNIDLAIANVKAWRATNPDKVAAQNRKWRVENPAEARAKDASRRKSVRQATPDWVDRTAIVSIYENCPPGHHVDHIIPLRGKNVSGLHVPWNLQYLPAEENIRKGNRVLELPT